MRPVLVTGGSGYIGSRLLELAAAQGRRVTALGRAAPGGLPPGLRSVPWRLGEALPDGVLAEAGPDCAVVHLAHDWTSDAGGDAGGANLLGTRALLASCRAAEVGRFVFVSSQSARADAANAYGRVKWAIEQELSGAGEASARVGLVYGGPPRAMWGLLGRLTGLSPVLPMVDPWRGVQPIHRDEVCRGLLLLADGARTGWVGLAGPEEMPFGGFLKALAAGLHGRRLRIFPIPLRLALLACDVLARVPFAPKVDRERVLGLAGTRPMACAGHLAELGLSVRPLETGLRDEPAARKALLREGRALLRYVLGAPPDGALTRRYARAVLATEAAGPLALPRAVLAAPGLLRAVEPLRKGSTLARRLALATALAEASPDGERALAGRSRGGRLAALFGALALDAAATPARLAAELLRR